MRLVFPKVYAIIDAALLSNSPLAWAQILAESGVRLIQYRDKKSPSRALLRISRSLIVLLRGQGVRLIVNDRADIAALAGADGVHVGQEDLGVEDARAVCGTACCVGVSTHTLEQVKR